MKDICKNCDWAEGEHASWCRQDVIDRLTREREAREESMKAVMMDFYKAPVYIFWWYSGSEYLFGGVFTEKKAAVEHMEKMWAEDEMQLYSKPFFVQEICMNIPHVINPYHVPETVILPEDVVAWRQKK